METLVVLVLAGAAWAQALFCASVLIRRSEEARACLPLAVFFVALCFASGGPLIGAFAPAWQGVFYELTVPAYLIMGPMLWFYVQGMMAETKWRIEPRHLRHLAPFGLALVLVVLDLSVPDFTVESPLMKWARLAYIACVGVLWAVTFTAWLWQSGYIAVQVFRRLPAYRRRLRTMLSNTDHRELRGAEGVAGLLAGLWIAVLLAIVIRDVTGVAVVPDWLSAALFFLLIWSLGAWALRQKPGFAVQDLQESDEPARGREKYQKSALGDDQAKRIAARIAAAMQTDRLYLDANLSLPRLARHIKVSANHISQTLNMAIGQSFFDYVNRWRVEAAKADLSSSNKPILDIAFDNGFNARSSFYRAFQRETGMTPTDYRKRHAVRP